MNEHIERIEKKWEERFGFLEGDYMSWHKGQYRDMVSFLRTALQESFNAGLERAKEKASGMLYDGNCTGCTDYNDAIHDFRTAIEKEKLPTKTDKQEV